MRSGRTKALFVSGTPKSRMGLKTTAVLILLWGALALYRGISRFGPILPVVITSVFILLGVVFLAWSVAFCKLVIIFKDAIMVPLFLTSLRPRALISLSEISEIRLNAEVSGFKQDVEIITAHGKTIKIPKTILTNWGEFYRVLTEDLKGKVRVIE